MADSSNNFVPPMADSSSNFVPDDVKDEVKKTVIEITVKFLLALVEKGYAWIADVLRSMRKRDGGVNSKDKDLCVWMRDRGGSKMIISSDGSLTFCSGKRGDPTPTAFLIISGSVHGEGVKDPLSSFIHPMPLDESKGWHNKITHCHCWEIEGNEDQALNGNILCVCPGYETEEENCTNTFRRFCGLVGHYNGIHFRHLSLRNKVEGKHGTLDAAGDNSMRSAGSCCHHCCDHSDSSWESALLRTPWWVELVSPVIADRAVPRRSLDRAPSLPATLGSSVVRVSWPATTTSGSSVVRASWPSTATLDSGVPRASWPDTLGASPSVTLTAVEDKAHWYLGSSNIILDTPPANLGNIFGASPSVTPSVDDKVVHRYMELFDPFV